MKRGAPGGPGVRVASTMPEMGGDGKSSSTNDTRASSLAPSSTSSSGVSYPSSMSERGGDGRRLFDFLAGDVSRARHRATRSRARRRA